MTTPTESGELTIDDLAAASGVPSRTIRFYQSKGVLPRPELRGRVAFYGPAHVERLTLIASLQDRGLRIDAIRDLMARVDKGELDVNEWLGLDAQLQSSWAADEPRTVTEAELSEITGPKRPGILAALVRANLIERRGKVFLIHSPTLLDVALKLDAAGLDLSVTHGAAEILRKHLGRAAGELSAHFLEHAREGFGRDAEAADLTAAFQTLRPMGLEAVRVIFAQEMERALRKVAESGTIARLTSSAKKKKDR